MYSSWKRSAGVVVVKAAPPLTSSQLTVQAPAGLLESLAEKWHLPKELIVGSRPIDGAAATAKSQQRRASVSTTESKMAEATAEGMLVATARSKLCRGFEMLLQCLAPSSLAAGSSRGSACRLSRRELQAASRRWSVALQLNGQRSQQQLGRLLDNFWGLVDDLTADQPRLQGQRRRDGDSDSSVSLAELLQGLRTRVRTGRDLMELRRRLLQLAGGLFAVMSSSAAATSVTWTVQLLDALAAAVGAERAAEVRAALTMRAGDNGDGGRLPQRRKDAAAVAEKPSFGELRREAWLRLVHDQFF